MQPLIYLSFAPDRYPAGGVESVRALATGYEISVADPDDALEPQFERVEIMYGWAPKLDLPAMPNLRWFQQAGAGADWLDRNPEFRGSPVTLTNASGVCAIPISEHMLGLLLALARDLPASVRSQKDHQWGRRGRQVFELAGKRVLVLGGGAIGARFALLCAAMDMEVVALRRNPVASEDGAIRTVGPDDLAVELSLADVIANTLPLTSETRHILGRSQFDAMRDGAIVLNIGRGGTIDEGAMIDALRRGKLLGAGLDVFEKEPLPEESPLWEMDNVIITSHYSGSTPSYNERAFAIFLDNLERYLRDEPLRNVVDKDLGY